MLISLSVFRRVLLLLASCWIGLSPAFATTIRPPDFDELVGNSGRIVRATVHSVRPYEDSYEGKRIVRTEIVLNVLETLRGENVTSELRIRQLGGEIDGLRLEVGAMPKFEVGRELVLFLHGEGKFICPTVGWGHGKYFVDRSSLDGVARIRRSDGRMLTSLKQVAEPMHGIEAAALTAGSAETGMSLTDFRINVLELVEQGESHR